MTSFAAPLRLVFAWGMAGFAAAVRVARRSADELAVMAARSETRSARMPGSATHMASPLDTVRLYASMYCWSMHIGEVGE